MGDTSLFDSEYRETKYSFTKGPSQVRIGLDSGHHEKPGNQSNKYLKDGIMRNLEKRERSTYTGTRCILQG